MGSDRMMSEVDGTVTFWVDFLLWSLFMPLSVVHEVTLANQAWVVLIVGDVSMATGNGRRWRKRRGTFLA